MEYPPDIPKNNTADNLNDFPTDQIDVVDWNTITEDNNSVSNNILNSIPDNSQRTDLAVSMEYEQE